MNWLVRLYDKNDKVIDKFIIKDRTEREAEREAFGEVNRNSKCEDWTMTKYSGAIK